jgi:uncharacterized protein (TIGR03435 family)
MLVTHGGERGVWTMTKATGVVLAAYLACTLLGQTPTGRPGFEVASIKPNEFARPPRPPQFNHCANGTLVSKDDPLKDVFEWAYGVNYYQFSEVPPWFDSFQSTYNIEAKAAGPASLQQCKLMMQTLFEERFKLKLRREMKNLPVWALTVSKGGPKLHEVTSNSPTKPGGGVRLHGRPLSTPNGIEPPKGWSMAQLANALDGIPTLEGKPVIDRTGLSGIFEIDLDYSSLPGGDRPEIRDAVGSLGLRLDLSTAPMEFLVIEHVERPSAN